jgi:hypothetical protein
MKFKVAAVSSNTNSFGLHQVILVAQDGTALKALRTQQFVPKKGDVLDLDGDALLGYLGSLMKLSYECPERIAPDAPPGVVREVWGN